MNKKDGTIYIWINLVSPKKYVGQTTRPLKERISEHKYGKTSVLSKAIKKYGIDNFKIISFSCPEKDLDWTEGFLQKALNTIAPNGYNLITNEHQHKYYNEISIQRMRENHSDQSGEKSPWFGIKRPEHSKKMTGENNPAARPVLLISPEGIEYKLLCCAPFCKEHNLFTNNIYAVLNGKRKHHKGWTGKYLENNL